MTPHPFTPTFIAMARTAEEIQAMRPDGTGYSDGDAILEGDAVAWAGEYQARDLQGGRLIRICWGDDEEIVQPLAWLPRLDQLLGMLGDVSAFGNKAFYFDFESEQIAGLAEAKFLPELALAVVMRERFGKVWRGGVWVKA
jgi:hypothetical protein